MRDIFPGNNGWLSPLADMNQLLQGINTIRFLFRAGKNFAREQLQAVFALAMASDLWQNSKFSRRLKFVTCEPFPLHRSRIIINADVHQQSFHL